MSAIFRFLAFLAMALSASADSTVQNPLTVTYVGNTGYLIQCDGQKVAIDALFGGWTSDVYDIPSDSVVALMKSAQSPFDNIDIVAVTHWHDDHFNAGIVAQYLKRNARCIVLCPSQVADSLATRPEYSEIQSQIHTVAAPVDSVTQYSHGGISARILTSTHGSYFDADSTGEWVDIHRNTQNLEYYFAIQGRTFFHSGDAIFKDLYRYQVMGLGSDSIDIAFVQMWGCHDLPTFAEKLVRERLLSKKIFFTHLAPGQGMQLTSKAACRSYRKVTFPTRSLETWVIP